MQVPSGKAPFLVSSPSPVCSLVKFHSKQQSDTTLLLIQPWKSTLWIERYVCLLEIYNFTREYISVSPEPVTPPSLFCALTTTKKAQFTEQWNMKRNTIIVVNKQVQQHKQDIPNLVTAWDSLVNAAPLTLGFHVYHDCHVKNCIIS